MKCPQCGSVNNAHSPVEGGECAPQPGDASVCLYCRALSVFTEEGTLRPATDAERAEFLISDIDDQIKRAVQVARLFAKHFPGEAR